MAEGTLSIAINPVPELCFSGAFSDHWSSPYWVDTSLINNSTIAYYRFVPTAKDPETFWNEVMKSIQ